MAWAVIACTIIVLFFYFTVDVAVPGLRKRRRRQDGDMANVREDE
jgi:hypothetical protein